MNANEPNLHNPIRIVDLHYQAIFIPTDVEHHAASFDDAGVAIVRFHLSLSGPVCTGDLRILIFQGLFGISIAWMSFPNQQSHILKTATFC